MHIDQSQRFTTRRGGFLRQTFHLDQRPYDSTSSPSDQALGGPCRGDRLLAAHEEPPLARTSLRRVSPMHITVSMWAAAPSCTMPHLQNTGTGDRWKRLLSRASLTDTPYGPSRTAQWTASCADRGAGALPARRKPLSVLQQQLRALQRVGVNGEHRSRRRSAYGPAATRPRALDDLLRLLKATPLRGGDCRSARPT